MSVELGNTGHPIIDSLQGIQLNASTYDSERDKFAYVKNSVDALGALSLKGTELFVATAGLWIKQPEPDPEYRYYGNLFVFRAPLATITYMYDPDLPVDSLALRFSSPDVLSIDSGDEAPFVNRLVNVPVLAINHCRPPIAA